MPFTVVIPDPRYAFFLNRKLFDISINQRIWIKMLLLSQPFYYMDIACKIVF